MTIGIIGGTGAEGRGLAARLASAGLPVTIGSRSSERARDTIDRLRHTVDRLREAPPGLLEAASNDEIAERSDILVLAVPFAAATEMARSLGARLKPGALVIDVTVPVRFAGGSPTLEAVPEGSAAEHLRARLPPHVRLAASLKTIPAALLGQVNAPLDCDEFVCGDSSEARAAALDLLGRLPGLRLHDVGGLDAARMLEGMTVLAIRLNKIYRSRAARFRVVGI